MLGFREHVLEGLGTPVSRRFDRELVTRSQGEETPVLTPDLLDVFDEAVEVELLGLPFEGLEVDDHAVLPLIRLQEPLGNGVIRYSPLAQGLAVRPSGSPLSLHGGKI